MVSPILMVGSISGCVHSNQYGIFWQVEIRAIRHPLLVRAWLTGTAALLLQCIRNKTPPRCGLFRTYGESADLLLQRRCQEIHSTLPCVSGIFGTVAVFVVRILKGMTRIRVNLGLHSLAEFLQSLLKLVDVIRRNSAILSAKQSQDWSVDFLERLRIGGEVAVVDDIGRQSWLLERHVERIASAHAPPDRSDAIFLDVRLRREKLKSRV